jgi:hypothetical protein
MNIEDMDIEQFNKFAGEILKNHPHEGEARVNVFTDYVDFCKEVARDERFSLFVYFDTDGVAIDGFVIDKKVEGDSYDVDEDADFLKTLKLSSDERTKAIVELTQHLLNILREQEKQA